MIQIIAIKERNANQVDTDKIFYIPNEIKQKKKTIVLDSMTKKYNYAIENIILKNDDEFVCDHQSFMSAGHLIIIRHKLGFFSINKEKCYPPF